MAVVTINVNEYTPEATDEKLHAARSKFAELLQQQPGFKSYTVVKTGESSAVVIASWETTEAAEQLMGSASFRSQFDEIWAPLSASSEQRYRGEVVYSS